MKRVCVTNQKGRKAFASQWDSIIKKSLLSLLLNVILHVIILS